MKNLSHLSKKEDPSRRRRRGWWPACEGTSHPLQSQTPQLRSDHPPDHPSVLYALGALDDCFLDALASLESMMSVIVSLTEINWVTDRKFSLLQDVM